MAKDKGQRPVHNIVQVAIQYNNNINNNRRGLKNMKDLYEETKVRVACYITHSESAWIKTAWGEEFQKEGKSVKSEAEDALREVGENVEFCLDHVKIQGIAQAGDWRKIWKKTKKEN